MWRLVRGRVHVCDDVMIDGGVVLILLCLIPISQTAKPGEGGGTRVSEFSVRSSSCSSSLPLWGSYMYMYLCTPLCGSIWCAVCWFDALFDPHSIRFPMQFDVLFDSIFPIQFDLTFDSISNSIWSDIRVNFQFNLMRYLIWYLIWSQLDI